MLFFGFLQINGHQLFFEQEITYYAYADSYHRKTETMVVTEVETRGCNLNEEAVIHANMIVPSIPPTDNQTSNIIKVEYSVRVNG